MTRSTTWLLAARAADNYAREAEHLASAFADAEDGDGDVVRVPMGTGASVTKARALASLVVDLTVDAT